MLAAAELRKRVQNHAGQFTVTAKKLGDFLASIEAEESLRVQRLQDREAKNVPTAIEDGIAKLNPLGMTGRIDQQDVSDAATPAAISAVATSHDLTAYEEY
jgi:hypothetical protein